MARFNVPRRWLQFRLRSLMLATLAVALWLGIEVRHARRVQDQIAAIRDAGGQVECAACAWGLLRFLDSEAYGRQIVNVELPGSAVGDLLDRLAQVPTLARVRVKYDGTCDIGPNWDRLQQVAVHARIVAIGDQNPADWSGDEQSEDRFEGVKRRIIDKAHYGHVRQYRELLQAVQEVSEGWVYPPFGNVLVDVRQFLDGTLVELVVLGFNSASNLVSQRYVAVLLVRDEIVDWKAHRDSGWHYSLLHRVIEDLDHDGAVDLGFEFSVGDVPGERLSGDARKWLDVYRIERDGFHSLFDEKSTPERRRDRAGR